MTNDFEKTFDEYHELIRKEIAKDTELDIKVAKVEQLVYLMDSLVTERFSSTYREKVQKIKNILKKGNYFDKELNKDVFLNFNNFNTRKRRLDFLREWLSIMIREHPPFRLYGNLNRVDFG